MGNTNESLVKVTNEMIGDNNKLMSFKEMYKNVFNIIVADTYNFSQDNSYKLSFGIIEIDTKVDSNGNGVDLYKTDNGYTLHYRALNKIARAANLIFTDSRILERQIDEKGQVVYISHQVKWKMLCVDGTTIEGTAVGKWDYYKELATSQAAANKGRKHADAKAESNAKYRAIKEAIAEIPSAMPLDYYKKSFIIPRVQEDKNALLSGLPMEDQVALKKLRAARAFGVMDQMFPAAKQIEAPAGTPSEPTPPAAEPPADNSNIQDAQFTMAEPSKEEKNRILANEFRGVSQKERTEKILNLCKIKGKKNNNNTDITAAQVEKADENRQIAFIEELLNMNDIEEDLPL